MRILAIEDNSGDVRLIRSLLAEVGFGFEMDDVDSLARGLDLLRQEEVQIVLLDLHLPDSEGLDTLDAVRAAAPEIPVVVLTGLADDAVGAEAVQRGAQDYLAKVEVDGRGLARAIRYAIERHQMQLSRDREMEALETLSLLSTRVSAEMYGRAAVRDALPEVFARLQHEYEIALDLMLEARMRKAEHDISGRLRALGEELGLIGAGPRDAIQLHNLSLKAKSAHSLPQKTQAYLEEGRLLLIELMGDLASFYRNLSLGIPGDLSSGTVRYQSTTEGEAHEEVPLEALHHGANSPIGKGDRQFAADLRGSNGGEI